MFHKPLRAWRAFLRLPDVLKIAIVLIVLCLGTSLLAEERHARQGRDEVRILDVPCPYGAVLALLAPSDRARYREAWATAGGQSYFACAREAGGMVHFVYEDGNQGLVPLQDFKVQRSTGVQFTPRHPPPGASALGISLLVGTSKSSARERPPIGGDLLRSCLER